MAGGGGEGVKKTIIHGLSLTGTNSFFRGTMFNCCALFLYAYFGALHLCIPLYTFICYKYHGALHLFVLL
jgi:hypothetical protein